MKFSQEFYRRRLDESLRFDREDDAPQAAPSGAALGSEGEVLAVAGDDEFVRQAYRFVLGRDPDAGGLKYYSDMAHRRGRAIVIEELRKSDEARRQQKETGAEAGAGAGRAVAGDVRSRNPELSDLLAVPDDGGFVARAYLRILERLPDPEGFINWIRRLHTGESRQALLHGLASSAEAVAHGAPFTLHGRPLRPPTTFDRARHAVRRRLGLNGRPGDPDVAAAAVGALAAVGAPRPVVPIGPDVVATEIDGFVVGIPSEEWRLVAYHVFRGVLEPGVTRRFCHVIEPGMVVVDVGANLGLYTLHAARLAGPDGRVHCFEPTPRMQAILRDNIQINGLLESGRVMIHHEAVTDRRGRARFAVYPGNNGHNTLFPGDSDAAVIDVETTTLDEALAEEPRVDVIKIDAEGAEPAIWAGMTSVLDRNPGIRVFMEFAPSHLLRAGHDPAALLDRIAEAGFLIERLADETGEAVPETRQTLLDVAQANLLLARERA